MHDDEGYRGVQSLVYVNSDWAFEIGAIWDGVEAAEMADISLDEIGRALSHNWVATVIALARKNIAVLRALTAEAKR
jgi:hypothetical protein